MPFTFSHPASVIDFPKRYFSLSALVIGSFLPDLEYFLRLEPVRHHLHSWPGFLWIGIPMGLFIHLFFHLFLKYPILSLFPKAHQEKLIPVCRRYKMNTAKDLFKILFSILIGILSHLILDSFTHEGSFMVEHIPFLQITIIKFSFLNLTTATFLQYFSTIIGMGYIILKYFIWFHYCTEKVRIDEELFSIKKKLITILSIITLAPLAAILYGIVKSGILYDHSQFYEFGGYTLLASISFGFIGFVIFCFRMHFEWNLIQQEN